MTRPRPGAVQGPAPAAGARRGGTAEAGMVATLVLGFLVIGVPLRAHTVVGSAFTLLVAVHVVQWRDRLRRRLRRPAPRPPVPPPTVPSPPSRPSAPPSPPASPPARDRQVDRRFAGRPLLEHAGLLASLAAVVVSGAVQLAGEPAAAPWHGGLSWLLMIALTIHVWRNRRTLRTRLRMSPGRGRGPAGTPGNDHDRP